MRLSTLALLAAPVALAQSSSSMSGSASASASAAASSGSSNSSTAYLTQILGALEAANLTSLVGVASAIANTTDGMALLSQLAVGNKTVFAPDNSAFANVSSDTAMNTTLLTQILSYHILNSTYTANNTATSPNHTIARTLLNGGAYMLPGNRSAPLVLSTMGMMNSSMSNSTNSSMSSMGSLMINQAMDNVTTLGGEMAGNLMVYIIPEVLSLPPSIGDVATELLPALASVISSSGLLEPLAMADGITVFAPSNAALSAVMSELPSNATLIQTILANHVINGTVAYSTNLMSGNYTSAAGEPFTFMSNSTGMYVTSANSTAMIVQSDIIIENGVVYVIDGVLLNTMSNSAAAASAYSSGQAAASSTDNASPATSSASASGSASKAAAGQVAPFAFTSTLIGGAIAIAGLALGGGFVLA